jgi:hypothetical protein
LAIARPPDTSRFTTVADGVQAQVITRAALPPHLDDTAHEGRVSCPCRPLLPQLAVSARWPVQAPRGAAAACRADAADHGWAPYLVAVWRGAPVALAAQAAGGRVDLLLTRCAFCGTVEVRDVSFHHPAGLRSATLTPRRRSDVLGWYAGRRPGGRTYL